jgi:hypothetical protein
MKAPKPRPMLKSVLATACIAAAAALSQGCTETTDPGVCYTTGDFARFDVSRDYVVQNCVDWVYLLVDNCIGVYGLPANPTPESVGAFCGSIVFEEDFQSAENGYPSYGGDGRTAYLIEHTCNFIDNPSSSACSVYAGAEAPIETAMADGSLIRRLSGKLEANKSLKSAASQVRIGAEGLELDPATGALTPVQAQRFAQ